MSNVPLSPPLPPPFAPQLLITHEVNPKSNKPQQPTTILNELQMQLERLLSINENWKIFFLNNVELEPQIQNGPKCGLVALSMASSVHQARAEVNDIFQEAQKNGYTKQGEIFNVNFLADLANKCCGFTARIIEGGLNSHLPCIIKNLIQKKLLLVPYDSDHNHTPCCKKGFKAHWAVISGIAILSASDIGNESQVVKLVSSSTGWCDCKDDFADQNITFHNHEGQLFLSKRQILDGECLSGAPEGKIYLIARQGKSRHIALWPFDATAESNDNLMCFSPDREFAEYIVPEGGLEEGLRGRAVILNVS